MTATQIDALAALREEWEEGLTVCSVLPPTVDHQLVVLSSMAGDPDFPEDQRLVYHCHRYFELGIDNWTCSVDATHIPVEGVWKWLASPSTLSCEN